MVKINCLALLILNSIYQSKFWIISILCILLPLSSKADYGGYYLSLELKQKTGSQVIYAYLGQTEPDMDSLNSKTYLLKQLDASVYLEHAQDTLYGFRNLFTYTYSLDSGKNAYVDTVRTGLNTIRISHSDIVSLRVAGIYAQSLNIGLSGIKTMSDTSWTKLQSAQIYRFEVADAYCEYTILIHVVNHRTESTLKKLKAHQEKINLKMSMKVISTKEIEAFHQETHQILNEFWGEKVVWVTECTD